jgi:hypothetical protein
MRRLTLASAALLLAFAALPSAPAEAGWRIVRWPNGDCKIWNDLGVGAQPVSPPPWTLLTPRPLPTWEASWVVLTKLQAKRLCTI